MSSTKHVLVEQYHFKLDKDFGNFSAGTDIGLWLFVLDREKKERGQEMIFTEEDDSILEVECPSLELHDKINKFNMYLSTLI